MRAMPHPLAQHTWTGVIVMKDQHQENEDGVRAPHESLKSLNERGF